MSYTSQSSHWIDIPIILSSDWVKLHGHHIKPYFKVVILSHTLQLSHWGILHSSHIKPYFTVVKVHHTLKSSHWAILHNHHIKPYFVLVNHSCSVSEAVIHSKNRRWTFHTKRFWQILQHKKKNNFHFLKFVLNGYIVSRNIHNASNFACSCLCILNLKVFDLLSKFHKPFLNGKYSWFILAPWLSFNWKIIGTP